MGRIMSCLAYFSDLKECFKFSILSSLAEFWECVDVSG